VPRPGVLRTVGAIHQLSFQIIQNRSSRVGPLSPTPCFGAGCGRSPSGACRLRKPGLPHKADGLLTLGVCARHQCDGLPVVASTCVGDLCAFATLREHSVPGRKTGRARKGAKGVDALFDRRSGPAKRLIHRGFPGGASGRSWVPADTAVVYTSLGGHTPASSKQTESLTSHNAGLCWRAEILTTLQAPDLFPKDRNCGWACFPRPRGPATG